jgi:hypothetical protein
MQPLENPPFCSSTTFFLANCCLHSHICEIFIYFQDRSAYSAEGKYVDRSWEYTAHRHMNVEIRTEATQFPGKEYMNGVFLAVYIPPVGLPPGRPGEAWDPPAAPPLAAPPEPPPGRYWL